MLKNTLNAIIQALKKHESVESIQRFTNMQNILKQYGYRNILSLTRQAHINEMELSDVRIEEQWKKIGVNPNTFSKKLLVYSLKTDENGNSYLREEIAYDISHTDATAQAVVKRETIVKADNYELLYENFKNYILETFPKLNISFAETYVSNAYYPHSKTVTLYNKNPPLENINFLIQTLYKETVYGEDIRSHKYFDMGDNKDSAIQKLITNSILNRFSIEPDQIDNRLSFNETQELFQKLEVVLEEISKNTKIFDKKLQIGQFINEKLHDYDELYKFQKEFDRKLKKLTGTKGPKNKSKEKTKGYVDLSQFNLTKAEKDSLIKKTNDEIALSNPTDLLNELGYEIDDRKSNDAKIMFKKRAENTASAIFRIKGDVWFWKDYGANGSKGNSITLVKEAYAGMDDAERYDKLCRVLNVTNYYKDKMEELEYLKLQALREANWSEIDIAELNYRSQLPSDTMTKEEKDEACKKFRESLDKTKASELNSSSRQPSKATEESLRLHEEKIQRMREKNALLEKQHSVNSRVTYISKTIPQNLITFLKSRGIKNTQIDNFYYIKGESWKLNDNDIAYDIKSKEGVGVLCADATHLKELYGKVDEKGFFYPDTPISQEQIIGADIHFPPYSFTTNKGEEVTMKTISLGAKKNTTFIDYQGDTIAPIESKMDYAAAAQEFNFKSLKIDVDIANSTSNADMIANNIAVRKYPNIYFLNQFDIPGVRFLVDIHNKAKEQGHNIDKFKYIDYKPSEYKQDINDLVKNNISLEERTREGALEDLIKLLDKIATVENNPEKLEELEKVSKQINDSIIIIKDEVPPSVKTMKA